VLYQLQDYIFLSLLRRISGKAGGKRSIRSNKKGLFFKCFSPKEIFHFVRIRQGIFKREDKNQTTIKATQTIKNTKLTSE